MKNQQALLGFIDLIGPDTPFYASDWEPEPDIPKHLRDAFLNANRDLTSFRLVNTTDAYASFRLLLASKLREIAEDKLRAGIRFALIRHSNKTVSYIFGFESFDAKRQAFYYCTLPARGEAVSQLERLYMLMRQMSGVVEFFASPVIDVKYRNFHLGIERHVA